MHSCHNCSNHVANRALKRQRHARAQVWGLRWAVAQKLLPAQWAAPRRGPLAPPRRCGPRQAPAHLRPQRAPGRSSAQPPPQ
eukprot:3302506-Pyramimonas_sp.AAC.1